MNKKCSIQYKTKKASKSGMRNQSTRMVAFYILCDRCITDSFFSMETFNSQLRSRKCIEEYFLSLKLRPMVDSIIRLRPNTFLWIHIILLTEHRPPGWPYKKQFWMKNERRKKKNELNPVSGALDFIQLHDLPWRN